MRLTRSFYNHPTRQLAQALLGCRLVRRWQGQRLSGLIVETEAYIGETDLACHARAGRTARTAVMYGQPGRAYVYFTYGMHWMLNVVSEAEHFPAAVLIRALEPQEGLDVMQQHRPVPRPIELCRGPAKLTQALRIDRALNGVDLCSRHSELWIESGVPVPARGVGRGPRVGLGNTPEPWKSKPWRYWVKDNPFVSK
ncbi:Putative 3-methyladenine DNA glycosylase [Thermoflexales bacterium]|nr:Putative 3-methyladenine DNA glycosylase [Thermoflexales bacterium]